jgi:enterochelin esterase-like enzyme
MLAITMIALVASAFAGPAPAAFAAPPAPAGTDEAPGEAAAAAGLPPFPADEAPFDAGARRELAMDALTFFVRQHGLFPGRGVYQLPAAPWFGGAEAPAPKRAWDMTVPAGVPLYLLAHAESSGDLDPSSTTVTVNGLAVPGLAAYVHAGVPALADGHMRDYAVLDLVFAPPPAGRYRVEVRTRFRQGQTSEDAPSVDDSIPTSLSRSATGETALSYDLTVPPPDVLGPLLLRDDAGSVFATLGGERRRVPDAETLQLLGYSPQAQAAASPGVLAALPEGAPLPELREGMLVRAGNSPAVFRLQGGQRIWIKNAELAKGTGAAESPVPSPTPDVRSQDDLGAPTPDVAQGTFGDSPTAPDAADAAGATGSTSEVRTVEAPVLQTIPPALLDDLLLKGAAADVFHVDRGALRKVPDWKWVTDRGLRPSDLLYVPDRVIAALPQTSPHWVTPGGTWADRSFYSQALGRAMPYRVYLPPGYESPIRASQRYPVIYLLHGMGGRYDEWSGYGVEEVANQLLAGGRFAHVILVMPQGGLGYWMNQDGGTPWADYVAHDLVGHVDATYRTLAEREARAIGGLSMGAHGAVQLALNYPALFGVVGAHSPSIRSRETAPAYFGNESGFARRDPVTLVHDAQLADPPAIWIDAGETDFWKAGAEALHQALAARGWAHEWHVYPGEHDGWYWGDHLWEYLPYYSTAFARNGVPLTR